MDGSQEPGQASVEPTAADDEKPRKPSRVILAQEIIAGLAELRRPTGSLFLSSFSAGLDLGFSVLLIGVVYTHLTELGPALERMLAAAAYSIGYVLVILGRSELFTEHTTLAVLPVLDDRSTVQDLFRVWSVVLAGNILGVLSFVTVLVLLGPALGAVESQAFSRIAIQSSDHPWWVIIPSGVLTGWLMGELGWVVTASRDTISQIACVFIITSAIGIAHLHHVIVSSAEVAAGFLGGVTTVFDLVRVLALAGLGNVVGGVVFVAIIKYGHAKDSEPVQSEEQTSL